MTRFTRDTSVSSAGFEPSIPAMERPQTYALHLKATTIGEHLPLTLQDRVEMSFNYLEKTATLCHSED